MAVEIERKFLLKDESWRAAAMRSERLKDGLVASTEGRKARVRIYEDRATVCIKTRRVNGARFEFEYDIPGGDAEQLLQVGCGDNIIDKIRHYVPFGGRIWEVDEYLGALGGTVIAEIEFQQPDSDIALPPWLGDEITGRDEYKKINLLEAARKRALGSGPAG
jgi:CYTH domain-containing protein